MKSKERQKHHIVPEAYLRKFADYKGQIVKLRLDLPHTKCPNTRKFDVSAVAYKKNFYRFNNDTPLAINTPYDKNILENRGFSYENNIEKLINKVLKKGSLSYREASEFTFVLFDIKVRNQRFRESSLRKANIEETFDNTLKSHINDPNFINNLFSNYNVTVERYVEIFESLREVWLSDDRMLDDLHNMFLLSNRTDPSHVLNTIINRLLNGKWMVLKAPIGNPFITSDNPGFCQDENNDIYNVKFGGNFIFYFPLDPYHILLIHPSNGTPYESSLFKDIQYIDTDSDWVRGINRTTSSLANREIYATNERPLIKAWYSLNRPFLSL